MHPSDFDGYCSRAILMCARDFRRKYRCDFTDDRRASQRVAIQLQRVRRCLHYWPTVYVELLNLYNDIDYKITFTGGCRDHGQDEWDFDVPDEPATPRSTREILDAIYADPPRPLIPPGLEVRFTFLDWDV